jgi:hypothetical protein
MAGDDLKTEPVRPWAGDHPAFLAHMNMLQAIVTRLATSSASCKTWCMGLVTALLSLAGSMHAPGLLSLAVVPVAVFAFLDANYLSQERWFRSQFGALAEKAGRNGYAHTDLFAIQSLGLVATIQGFVLALFSWSIWPVYGGLVAAYLWARKAGLLDLLLAAAPGG